MAQSKRMHCCALHHLILGEWDALESIKQAIKNEIAAQKETAPKAWFAVTKPLEVNVVKNLKLLGFKEMAEFPRCDIYLNRYKVPASETKLTMWWVDINDIVLDSQPKTPEATNA